MQPDTNVRTVDTRAIRNATIKWSRSASLNQIPGYVYSWHILYAANRFCSKDDDAEKINHRIPHRFEPITNIGANWCCHCGYMLPLGRKNARRCTECDITCHANCAHLVPDFCGMSMETANMLLRDWKDINRARADRAHRPPTAPSTPSQPPMAQYPGRQPDMDHVAADVGRLQLTGQEPPLPPKTPEYGYARPLPPTQSPPRDPRAEMRMQAQLQQQAGQYPPATPPQGMRPLPSSRPTYPGEPMQPPMHQGRATPGGYDQDGYYQVRMSCIFRLCVTRCKV